ncbi:MAG: response regulator transcription factor, partial [Acidimicrobiales bacterium]
MGDGQDHEDVRPVTVLLAEDEESFVEALVVGLGREGFEVVVARDGTEALERFDSVSPDVVLLDLMLPKLSGIDVCRAIRARSSVPIIMVTAKATELDTVVGLEVGADDYVTKPYRLRELVARMRAVLRRSPHAPGLPTSQATIPSGEAGALRSGAGAGAGAGTSTVTGATGTHSSDAGAGVGAGVGAGEAPTHRSGAGA